MFRLLLFTILILLFTSCSTSKRASHSSNSRVHQTRTVKKSDKATSVVDFALSQIGSKYSYGGNGEKGYDCSGLVSRAYSQIGVQLPRRSADMALRGEKINLKSARPGDLIFFTHGTKINHVAMVTAADNRGLRMVHSTSSRGVIEEYLQESKYWSSRVKLVRRVLGN